MTDVTSEKLYSKLDRINNVKRNLKKVMIEIGGYEYFQNDPKFETYPEILGQIQTRISTINRAMDITVYGKDPTEVISTADTTYKKVLPYLDELQYCRALLIDNLNTKGVEANTDDTLRTLVGKVLDIESGGGREPFEEVIMSVSLGYFVLDFVYIGYNSSDGRFYENLDCRIKNNDSVPHDLENPFYRIHIGNDDVSYSTILKRSVVAPHNWYEYGLAGTLWHQDPQFTALIEDIRNGAAIFSYDEYYRDDARIVNLQFDDIGALDLEVYMLNTHSYFFYCIERTYSGEEEFMEAGYTLAMLSPDGERKHILTSWSRDDILYPSGWRWWYRYPQNEEEVEDFAGWETNEFILEEVEDE